MASRALAPKKSEPLSPFPSRTLWTLPLNNALVMPPVYEGTFAYFSIEGDRIASYDVERGTLRWLVSARVRSAPAIGDGLLFLETADSITALHTSDGSVAWQVPFAGTLAAPLAYDNEWLIAAGRDGAVSAFRAADGTIVWHTDVGVPARATPSLAADHVYLSLEDGRVVALRVTNGGKVWERPLSAPPNEILALDGRVFVGSNDNFLYCLNTKNGQREWRVRTGADVVSRPIGDRDRVYFTSLDNVLRAVNVSNGVQQWKKPLPFRPLWSPLKAADTVVVGGIGGQLRGFFLKDGTPAGELPAVAGGGELKAPLHAFETAATFGPTVTTIMFTLATGASVKAVSRSVDPPVVTILTPLPGVVPVTALTRR